MKIFLSLAALVAVSYALPTHLIIEKSGYGEVWEAWKEKHGKIYESQPHEIHRFGVWMENLEKIARHNLKHELGLTTFTLGANKMADLTNEEYRAMYLSPVSARGPSTNVHQVTSAEAAEVDWRNQGYVTGVKDQGQCGSCWSFSATGSTEGQYKKTTGNLLSFSEQQLVDCSTNYGNNGCNGGSMDAAFQYMEAYKIEQENDYPYEAHQSYCRFDGSKGITNVKSYTDVASYSESSLKNAVGTAGPVSVAIDASHASFQLYNSGIYDELACSSFSLDHGVLAVGYGSDGGDYWIVKNSWGPGWGEQGYIQMSRNKNNQCGIASMASYPQL